MSTSKIDGDLLHLLSSLIREPCVTGAEDAFFRILRRELDEFPISIERYHGLLVARGNRPNSMFLSAHVDRNGLLCTGPNEFQYAAFIAGNRGELHGDSISEQFMDTIASRFQEQRVQAHTPYTGTYLGQGQITNCFVCPRRKNLIFEVKGLEFLQPGTPVSFLDRMRVENGFVSAQLDNVAMVAMVVHLFRLGFQGTALFTASEEAGKSWRFLVEWFKRLDLETDRLLVLDTSPFSGEAVNSQAVVLRNQDANAEFNPQLTSQLQGICERLGHSLCYKDEFVARQNRLLGKASSLGRTELGRTIAATGGAITGTTLQLPTTAYHTAQETASLSSYHAVLDVLLELQRES